MLFNTSSNKDFKKPALLKILLKNRNKAKDKKKNFYFSFKLITFKNDYFFYNFMKGSKGKKKKNEIQVLKREKFKTEYKIPFSSHDNKQKLSKVFYANFNLL